jgi:hypothetical protein
MIIVDFDYDDVVDENEALMYLVVLLMTDPQFVHNYHDFVLNIDNETIYIWPQEEQ